MSGTARRCRQYEAMSAPVIAVLIERRLIDSWPFEVTRGGMSTLRGAPGTNIWRLALAGDPTELAYGLLKEPVGLKV